MRDKFRYTAHRHLFLHVTIRNKIDSETKTSTLTGLRRRAFAVVADRCLDIQHAVALDSLRCSHRLDAMFEGPERPERLHIIRRDQVELRHDDPDMIVSLSFSSRHVTDSNRVDSDNARSSLTRGISLIRRLPPVKCLLSVIIGHLWGGITCYEW